MRADVHGDHQISLDEKYGAQVALNVHRVDGAVVLRGKPVNLVRSQARVKRIFFEDFHARRVDFFWPGVKS